MTAEFDSFFLLSCYVPNSGDGLRRLVMSSSILYYVANLFYSSKSFLTDVYAFNSSHTELENGIHLLAAM